MFATRNRRWVAGTLVVSMLIVVAGWFLAISPKRAEAAELEQQTADTVASNQQLATRIEQLKLQFAQLPEYQAKLAAIKQAMPEDPALPTLVRDLDDMADRADVTLMSLAPGQPAAVASPAPVAPPAEGEAADGESSEGSDDADSTEGTDGAAVDPAGAPTATPVGAGMVLVSIPVNVVTVGDFFKTELFLKDLQADMPRAFLVQNLTVATEKDGEASGGKPATKNGDVTMTITGSVFVLKQAEAAPVSVDPTTTTP